MKIVNQIHLLMANKQTPITTIPIKELSHLENSIYKSYKPIQNINCILTLIFQKFKEEM